MTTKTCNKRIYYTSLDGNIITPYNDSIFGVNIISNVYANGQGVLTFDDDITLIGEWAFFNCSNLTSVIIPNSVTKIGSHAFFRCKNLTSVIIPDSVTSIGDSAFFGCSNLTSITIPQNTTSIGEKAFLLCSGELIINCNIPRAMLYSCSVFTPAFSAFPEHNHYDYLSGFSKITIGDTVTKIGAWAFKCCNCLTSVTIGNGVTSIGNAAFLGCHNLTSVYCKAITPPTEDGCLFLNIASVRKIYVPRKSVKAYKSAKGWSEYAKDIVGYDF